MKQHNPLPAWYYLLAILLGASLTLAFAPIDFTPVAFIAPAGLFYLLLRATTLKQHLALNYLFALGLFGTGASWVFYAMYFFSHAHILLAIGFTFIYIAVIASLFLLQGSITYLFRQSTLIIKLLMVFPLAWVIGEAFRGWFLTGFPWLLIGHSHIDNLLSNSAPVWGTLGVSYFSLLISASLVVVFQKQIKQKFVALATILLISIISYTLSFINWVSPTGESLSVAMIQGNIAQENKWKPEHLRPALDLYMKKTEEHWDADLIIWPETAIAGYFREHFEDVINPLQKKSLETQTDLVIGGFYYNTENEVPSTENSILVINPDNRAIYSKQHRVPFSEYVPLLKYLHWLDKWINLPYDNIGKGTGPVNLTVAGQLARLSICYEDAFGEEIINGLPAAGLLINLSNDGWFTGSIEPYQHMQIARMRALETGRYMLRSTNIGVSGIINHKGKIISTAPAYQLASITGEAKIYQGATPYVRLGNWLILLYSFIGLAVAFMIRMRHVA